MSEETEYTPGRWKVGVSGLYVNSGNDLHIMNAGTSGYPEHEKIANIHRTVACVNALAGIPVADVEAGIVVRWRLVSEGFPPETDILSHCLYLTRVNQGICCLLYEGGGKWSEDCLPVSGITHWADLPKGPRA